MRRRIYSARRPSRQRRYSPTAAAKVSRRRYTGLTEPRPSSANMLPPTLTPILIPSTPISNNNRARMATAARTRVTVIFISRLLRVLKTRSTNDGHQRRARTAASAKPRIRDIPIARPLHAVVRWHAGLNRSSRSSDIPHYLPDRRLNHTLSDNFEAFLPGCRGSNPFLYFVQPAPLPMYQLPPGIGTWHSRR